MAKNLEPHYRLFEDQASKLRNELAKIDPAVNFIERYNGLTKNRHKQLESQQNWIIAFYPSNWATDKAPLDVYYSYRYGLSYGKVDSRLYINTDKASEVQKTHLKDEIMRKATKQNVIIPHYEYHPNAGASNIKSKLFMARYPMGYNSYSVAVDIYKTHQDFHQIIADTIHDIFL